MVPSITTKNQSKIKHTDLFSPCKGNIGQEITWHKKVTGGEDSLEAGPHYQTRFYQTTRLDIFTLPDYIFSHYLTILFPTTCINYPN